MKALKEIEPDSYRPPTPEELAWARERFQALEPRDLFYRVASTLVAGAIGGEKEFTLGEAVAVLLMSWNSNYYRFRKPDPTHVGQIETLLDKHWTLLTSLRSRRIEALDEADFAAIVALFEQFEQLLGPVGAAKALHLLAPDVFPIWDGAISIKYRCRLGRRGTNGKRYTEFMAATARQCQGLAAHDSPPTDTLKALKALDEWNYVRYTRGEIFEPVNRPTGGPAPSSGLHARRMSGLDGLEQ